ncbi:MAG TPA: glycosyltransferase [Burkholderiales bacterium]
MTKEASSARALAASAGEPPLRILHVYRTYFPDTQGGLEETIRQLCIGSTAAGAECRVFTLSPAPAESPLDYAEAQVHQVKRHLEVASCGIGLTALRRFNELVQWADVVNYHFPWPFMDLMHCLSPMRRPAVVTYHSDVVRQRRLGRLYAPLRDRFLDDVDAIAATSPNYVASSPILRRYRHKITTIPIGLNRSSYPAPTVATLARVEARHGRDFFLFIGVLRYYKGLEVLLEAVRGTDLRVLIVGTGPIEAELQRRAEAWKLSNVAFAGYVDDETKVALLRLCRAVVLPSHERSEAFSIALLEGAMMGKPLVSCEIRTGTSYVNANGVTGFVVEPRNPAALRAAMRALRHDDARARAMGAAARRRFERMFTGQHMARRYLALYRELLRRREARSAAGAARVETSKVMPPAMLGRRGRGAARESDGFSAGTRRGRAR